MVKYEAKEKVLLFLILPLVRSMGTWIDGADLINILLISHYRDDRSCKGTQVIQRS